MNFPHTVRLHKSPTYAKSMDWLADNLQTNVDFIHCLDVIFFKTKADAVAFQTLWGDPA